MFSYADKFTTGQDNCAQLSGIKRNWSRIARNWLNGSQLWGVYIACNCAQVKSTCVGLTTVNDNAVTAN